ncbi:MAG: ROK family protein [Bosea sp. (in: a-proteobacteria)]
MGIDLGGTKIEGLVLDEGGGELIRRRIPTPRGDYSTIVSAIADLVRSLEAEAGTAGQARVGVGIPGVISPATGLVKNANTTEINGHPLDRDLSAALGREVSVHNDANCFVLSEATDGAGQGTGVVFGVIIGTGVGGGLVVDGRIVGGRHLIGGEWGHNPLPWPSVAEVEGAQACFCGKAGCMETWVSGPAFARDYFAQSGRRLTAHEIVTHAQDYADAQAALQRYMHRLARGLASLVNVIDPDVIVLGGGMANVARLYAELPDLMRPYVTSDSFTTPILKARHGDSSGVRGAAWL